MKASFRFYRAPRAILGLAMEGKSTQVNDGGGTLEYAPSFITAAHELKAPLALVRQLSLSLQAGELPHQQIREAAQRITLTSERALRLTTNLTKTARLEDALFELEPINPVSLCQEVAGEIAPLYTAQGRQLRVRANRRSQLALANRDLLRRILMNFLDNALHYSRAGAPVTLTAQVREGGSKVRLGVRDFGPAVSSVPQQGHNRPESSGLGVYIASQFAQAMNATTGTIRHRDGATFYVDIGTSTQLRLL